MKKILMESLKMLADNNEVYYNEEMGAFTIPYYPGYGEVQDIRDMELDGNLRYWGDILLEDYYMETEMNLKDELKQTILEDYQDRMLMEIEGMSKDLISEVVNMIDEEVAVDFTEVLTALYSKPIGVHLVLSKYEERNSDMGLLQALSGAVLDVDIPNVEKLIMSSGIDVLLVKQGYSIVDFIDYINGNKEDNFLKTVYNEIVNFPNHMGQLTIWTSVTLQEYCNIIDGQFESITVDKDSLVGIFNPWVGGGSLMDIELERDFTIYREELGVNMEYDDPFNIEIEKDDYKGYTISEVYGMSVENTIVVK